MLSVKTAKKPAIVLTKLSYPAISVGIDVSKEKLDVALIYADKQHSSHVFKNTLRGIKSIVTLLHKQGTTETVPCIIESTGNYHVQSAVMITQAHFAVKVINPLITKKYQKSSIRNAKSDPIDAHRLAQIGLLEPELLLFNADKSIISSKKLVSYLAHLMKSKQKLQASLKQLNDTKKFLEIKVNLKPIVKAIEKIDEQMQILKDEICAQAPEEAKKLADAVPGLSVEKISVLLCLVGDKQFSNRDQLVAFVGMDLALRKSGAWQGKQKLTKRGEPIARHTLYKIAWGLKQHNPIFKEYYDRLYRQEGKHYNTAMMAVARKFLKFLFAYYWKGTVTL
jgi:transposase